jgi:hypothetical protein
MLPRHVRPVIEEALSDTPAVMLVGARQTGKTTLARLIGSGRQGTVYVTLDDATALEAALSDPTGFVSGLPRFAVIDEVQKTTRSSPGRSGSPSRP